MMFLPILAVDLIWDGMNYYSYRKDKKDEQKTIESGEKLVEEDVSFSEYDYNDDNIDNADNTKKPEIVQVEFEDENKIAEKRGILSSIKSFLTFSKPSGQEEISKAKKREEKMRRKYDITVKKREKSELKNKMKADKYN